MAGNFSGCPLIIHSSQVCCADRVLRDRRLRSMIRPCASANVSSKPAFARSIATVVASMAAGSGEWQAAPGFIPIHAIGTFQPSLWSPETLCYPSIRPTSSATVSTSKTTSRTSTATTSVGKAMRSQRSRRQSTSGLRSLNRNAQRMPPGPSIERTCCVKPGHVAHVERQASKSPLSQSRIVCLTTSSSESATTSQAKPFS